MKTKLTIIGLVAVLLAGCGINTNNGDGEKVGQIVKIKKQGLIWKTWEAEIIRGGFSGGSGTVGAAFAFTVEDETLLVKVKDALEHQTEVLIKYRCEGVYSASRSDSGGDFLISIEPVKK